MTFVREGCRVRVRDSVLVRLVPLGLVTGYGSRVRAWAMIWVRATVWGPSPNPNLIPPVCTLALLEVGSRPVGELAAPVKVPGLLDHR